MKLKLTPLCSIVLSTLTLTACGGGGGSDDKKSGSNQVPTAPETMTVKLDMLEGRIAIPVQLVDAKTGEPIQQQVTLTASDDVTDANVYENANLGINADNSTGLSTIFLKADAVKTASKENPVKLRLIANSEGYFSSSIDINYDGTEAAVQRISLVKVTAPPDGVAVAEQKNVTAKSDGTLQVPIQLSAKTAANDPDHRGAGASFSLPAGTVLKDRSGTPLTGDLKVTIGYFSPNVENIESVFPGGLSPDYVRFWEDGQWNNLANGKFISAGLLAVDIVDSQGRKAHQLGEQKATMTIQTPAGLINPETNQPIKDGDTIPVWSHSESNGLWQKELTGKFKKLADGNFEVTYTVNHLSYWNLDWHYYDGTDSRDIKCSTNVPIRYSAEFKVTTSLTANIYVKTENTIYTSRQIHKSTELTSLMNAPSGHKKIVEIKDRHEVIGRGVSSSCNEIVVEMDATWLKNNEPPEYCPNPITVNFSNAFYNEQGLYLERRYANGRTMSEWGIYNHHARNITPIAKNWAMTLNVKDRDGNIVGTVEKAEGSCADLTVQMNSQFIAANPPVEYCPNPVNVKFSKPFLHSVPLTVNSVMTNGTVLDTVSNVTASTPVQFNNMIKDRAANIQLVDTWNNLGVLVTATKPKDSCADVTLNVDNFPSSTRQITVKPRIQLNEKLSYDDVSVLISNMSSLNEATRKEILAYTHPQGANSEATFSLNNQSYQVLMDRWLSKGQIASLQALQAFNIQPNNLSLNFAYQIAENKTVHQTVVGKAANGVVTFDVPDGVTLTNARIYATGYINTGYINNVLLSLNKSITIPNNNSAVDVALEDVEAIRRGISYLKAKCKDGLPSTDPNAKYCGFFN